MSLGPLMVDLQGPQLTPEEREMLRHPLVGGVILFSRNFESVSQLEALTGGIRALRTPHPLIAVDHEGGPVQRFRDGFTRLPPVSRLGECYDRDRRRARRLAGQAGWLMAAELRAAGVDLSFAPVLDLAHENSQVLAGRCFHRKPEAVADLAHQYMLGMQRAGMQATGKHFPGHGGVSGDSHIELPDDPRPLEDILAEDGLPFERMVHYGLAAIMVAHVRYSAVDRLPAGYSRFWLQEILRGRLAFQGVIFSDDLSMEGASSEGDIVARVEKAHQAGCDMLLVCNDPAGVQRVLDAFRPPPDPVSQLRLARMHGRHPVTFTRLHADPMWREAVHALAGISHPEEQEIPL